MTRIGFLAWVTNAALALAAFDTSAATAIRYQIPEGLEYTFQETSLANNTLTIRGAGQQGQVQQVVTTTMAGTAKVIRTSNGRPTAVRLSFAPTSGTEYKINGTPQPEPYIFAGQTVDVQLRGEKIVAVTRDGSAIDVDANAIDAMAPFVVFHASLLPPRAVAVGDNWPAEVVSQDGSTRTALDIQVANLPSAADGIAEFQTRGTVQHDKDGSRATGQLTGRLSVDMATGLPRISSGAGTLTLAGSVNQNGYVMQINGQGTIAVERTIEIGPSSGAFGQNAAPLSRYDDGSTAAPQPAPAPATRAAQGDSRLVGMYAGETIYSGDYGNDDLYTNTQLKWVFNANGTVYFGSQAHFNYEHRDYNLQSQWGATGQSAADVDSGRWSTQGDILTIQWDNGNVATYAYGFEPNGALVFRNARTRKLINFYNRLQ